MQYEALLFIRVAFSMVFLLTLLTGVYFLRNYQKFFGADSCVPSETGSSRAYSQVHILLVWVHAVFLTGSLALLLH